MSPPKNNDNDIATQQQQEGVRTWDAHSPSVSSARRQPKVALNGSTPIMAHQNGSQHTLRGTTATALSAAMHHHSQTTASISNTVSNSRETIYNTQFWTAAGSPLSPQPQPQLDFAHSASAGSGSVDCGQMYRANQQMCSQKINAQQVYAPLMSANGECASGDRAVNAVHYSSTPLASPETISAHYINTKMPAESTQAAARFTATSSVPVSARMPADNAHEILWTLAESHFRQAQQRVHGSGGGGNGILQNAHDFDDWQSSVVAGVSCLYSVLRLCSSSRGPSKSGSSAMMLGPDVEARTRLRIAQALGQWCSESSGNQEQGEEDNEEEAQLVRAIMVVPKADGYVDTRYAIIATHCRLFLRRGEHRWAEQKLKSAAVDAQQRSLYHWVHYFALELAHLYVASNKVRSGLEVLQQSLKQAQQGSDRASEAVVGVQLLGLLIQERSWAAAFALAKDLAAPMSDSALVALPQVRARFWSLQAAGSAMLGHHQGAQEACGSARQCLKEWQALFAKALAKKCVSDGGSSFVIPGTRYGSVLRIRGWSYYEAHAWVMLVSAHATRGDNAHEKATGFLRLALEGIKRGETDGFSYQLKTTKMLVLLHVVDKALVTLQLSEAKLALDQIMAAAVEGQGPEANAFWRQSRDAIALRWAMYRHRMGDFGQAKDAYTCVAASDSQDLCFVAQVNQALMHVLANTDDSRARAHDIIKLLVNDCGSLDPHEAVRRSMLEFLQGLESLEPVKAKTHLLACLRTCTEVADTALQGWTLCLLGTLVLSTGQHDQAMKMCAAGQAIAQRANDPLQNAAAIGILTQIEKAVGDPERCAKLLQVNTQFLKKFNTQIQE